MTKEAFSAIGGWIQEVMAEVAKTFVHHRQQRDMFFWRDRSGREIDILLSRGEILYPLEIKSGQTVASDAFVHCPGGVNSLGSQLSRQPWSMVGINLT